jgi:hypothetical protein
VLSEAFLLHGLTRFSANHGMWSGEAAGELAPHRLVYNLTLCSSETQSQSIVRYLHACCNTIDPFCVVAGDKWSLPEELSWYVAGVPLPTNPPPPYGYNANGMKNMATVPTYGPTYHPANENLQPPDSNSTLETLQSLQAMFRGQTTLTNAFGGHYNPNR